ncbi:MAG: hypothetical protein ACLS54_08680 [Anaerostipes hadrus]
MWNPDSYSKLDPDATFMRMKEDAMLNGQLSLLIIAAWCRLEYIWIDISAQLADTGTLIPF